MGNLLCVAAARCCRHGPAGRLPAFETQVPRENLAARGEFVKTRAEGSSHNTQTQTKTLEVMWNPGSSSTTHYEL